MICLRIGLILLFSYTASGCSTYLDDCCRKGDYRPPLGTVMLAVETHHRKLAQAGLSEEWEFALYELEELEETFHEVSEYEYEQLPAPAGQMSSAMLYPAIEAVEEALKKQDMSAFKANYRMLTNSCNGCHTTSGVGFIKVNAPRGL